MAREQLIYQILSISKSCRSITDIANRLYLSQPYVSKEIHQAEVKYHTKLLHRRPLPIKLTRAGEVILESLEKQLELQNQLLIDLAPFRDNSASYIKIATNQPWTTLYGDIIYKYLHKKFPSINFELTEVTTDLAEQKLLTREIDLFAGKNLNNDKIVSNKTFTNRFYFLIPATSSLYSKTNYMRILTKRDLTKFNNQNFVSLTDDSFFQKLVDHMLIDNNVNQGKVLKVDNHVVGTNAAAQGAGIFVTSYDFAEKWIGKKPFNLVEIPTTLLNFDIAVSYHYKASTLIKEIAKSLEALEEAYGKKLGII